MTKKTNIKELLSNHDIIDTQKYMLYVKKNCEPTFILYLFLALPLFYFLLPSLICRYALTYNRDSNKLVDSEKYTLLWWYRKFLFNSNENRFRVLYKCTESNKIHGSCFIIVWYMFHIELTFMIQAFQVHHELWTIFPIHN